MKGKKRTIRFVTTLCLVCFMGSLTIVRLNGQQIPPDEIAVQATIQEPINPVLSEPAAPRIRYRDVITQLSDSIEWLRNDFSKTTQRLVEITQENDSLKMRLDLAVQEVLQFKSNNKSKKSSGGLSFISVLVLIISMVGLGVAALIIKFSRLRARQKHIEYKELFDEFENYRRSSRERFEKQAIDHFNELKKLKKI